MLTNALVSILIDCNYTGKPAVLRKFTLVFNCPETFLEKAVFETSRVNLRQLLCVFFQVEAFGLREGSMMRYFRRLIFKYFGGKLRNFVFLYL